MIGLCLLAIFWLMLRKPKRWLSRGKLIQQRWQADVYVEEVQFDDYHQALHHYFKLVDDVRAKGTVLEVKYSYLDWTYTVFRFADFTALLVRRVDRVRLIKSNRPMVIDEFEQFIEGHR